MPNVDKDMEQLIHMLLKMDDTATLKNSLAVSYKGKYTLPISLASPLLGIYPRKIKAYTQQRLVLKHP